MPDDQKPQTPPAGSYPPGAAPAAPKWTPKIGQLVLYTFLEKVRTSKGSEDVAKTYPLIVTGQVVVQAPEKDDKGNLVPVSTEVKVGKTAVTRQVPKWVDTVLYEGLYFSANMQFPVSKKGIQLSELAPVEV